MDNNIEIDHVQAVVLSFFHMIYGPRVFYVHPVSAVKKEVLNEISGGIDKITETGFFTQSTGDFTTHNLFFEVSSTLARGSKEMVLLSFLLPNKISPDIDELFQPLANQFKTRLMDTPEIFKGFHILDNKNIQEKDRVNIQEMSSHLIEWVIDTYDSANKIVFEHWVEKYTQNVLNITEAQMRMLNTFIFEDGKKILTAVKQGAKNRSEVMKLTGLGLSDLKQSINTPIALDLLTEGSELVLTSRGKKFTNSFSHLGFTEFEANLLRYHYGEILIKILNAIQFGARTIQDLTVQFGHIPVVLVDMVSIRLISIGKLTNLNSNSSGILKDLIEKGIVSMRDPITIAETGLKYIEFLKNAEKT